MADTIDESVSDDEADSLSAVAVEGESEVRGEEEWVEVDDVEVEDGVVALVSIPSSPGSILSSYSV